MRGPRRHRAAALLLIATVAGCFSDRLTIAPQPPGTYTEIGPAKGLGCGLLVFNLIPFRVNDRAARAYAKALREASATALIDTTVEDRWYFAVIGTVVCTEIGGQAIRGNT